MHAQHCSMPPWLLTAKTTGCFQILRPSMQSYVHTTEEDRAEYFRQWGRQLDKETTVLREAVSARVPKYPAT